LLSLLGRRTPGNIYPLAKVNREPTQSTNLFTDINSKWVGIGLIRLWSALLPQLLRQFHRINFLALPPSCFVSGIVEGTVMYPAEQRHPLITRFLALGTGLDGLEVMGIGGQASDHFIYPLI
jgi:hypothetical protein